MQIRATKTKICTTFTLRKHGFALVAALGVLATLFIMVVGIATLANTGISAVALQEAEARLDTLLNSLQSQMLRNLTGESAVVQTPFSLTFPYGTGIGIIEPLQTDAELYRQEALNFVEGDIVLRLRAKVPYLTEHLGKERHVLANRVGNRKTAIVLKETRHSIIEEQQEEK
jgi:hypothetical protein